MDDDVELRWTEAVTGEYCAGCGHPIAPGDPMLLVNEDDAYDETCAKWIEYDAR
ncbi:hypothetical protein J5X84_02375 [Streptosporangiaceae bacterium NEAU-GS5]|nr:hypothetical protein [Streptosporangiaceae bacterium NEAU-GS5]